MADDTFTKSPEFIERYANHVSFDLQGTDIKILFGNRAPNAPVLHTAMTLAWSEAKLLHYLLGQNIAIFETINGEPIQIPKAIMPSSPNPPTEEQIATSGGTAVAVHEAMKRLYEAFVASTDKTARG